MNVCLRYVRVALSLSNALSLLYLINYPFLASVMMTSVNHDPQCEASCHCGAVKLILPEIPKILNECRCSLCFKYGALWAYPPRNKVSIINNSASSTVDVNYYCWGDRNTNFYRCNQCGCVTHWLSVKRLDDDKSTGLMGVNCRMLKSEVVQTIRWQVTTGPELDHLFFDTSLYSDDMSLRENTKEGTSL